MNKITIGVFAHVDAGKTTLCDAILYETGASREFGRVDSKSSHFDTDAIEKQRGITVFSGRAVISYEGKQISILDTPGHVDFFSEAERVVPVIDAALLIVSAVEGVQAHTETLLNYFEKNSVPVIIFVSKLDLNTANFPSVMNSLEKITDGRAVDFLSEDRFEKAALCDDALLDEFLAEGCISSPALASAVMIRRLFPVLSGAALKGVGVKELLSSLSSLIVPREELEPFGAKVFKVSHSPKGERICYMLITGGRLTVKDELCYISESGDTLSEKINLITGFEGTAAKQLPAAAQGDIVAVGGLSSAVPGTGLGFEDNFLSSSSDAAFTYSVLLPDNIKASDALPKLLKLNAENPNLFISYDNNADDIKIKIMGAVQLEVIEALCLERFGIPLKLVSGRLTYRETIRTEAVGYGHYEPLRHFAEVKVLLEPLEPGSGIEIENLCPDDVLPPVFARQIISVLAEKKHLGVLLGAALTDVRISLLAGKAHVKHTEGGDFRQAAIRAVRQALMKAESVVLEPHYDFVISVPVSLVGRLISDLRLFGAEFDGETEGDRACYKGHAPCRLINDYPPVLYAYTGGKGRISLATGAYFPHPSPEGLIAETGYDPRADLENTPDSIFCSHGAGTSVPWNEADEFMHLSYASDERNKKNDTVGNFIRTVDDKLLESIMKREFGDIKRPGYGKSSRVSFTTTSSASSSGAFNIKKEYVIIDGYNLLFASEDLSELSRRDLSLAREKLVDLLSSYRAYTGIDTVLVFDAYKVSGNMGKHFVKNGLKIVYTKENETGDMYIEKLCHDIGRNFSVRVVTSDSLIRLSAIRSGVLRVSSKGFLVELERIIEEISDFAGKTNLGEHKVKLGDARL